MTQEEAIKLLTYRKVYVNGKSKEIQEKLFELGFTWRGTNRNEVGNTDYPFLFTNDSLGITHTNDMDYFMNNSLKEITAEELLNIKIDKEFKDGDILSAPIMGDKCILIYRGTDALGEALTDCLYYINTYWLSCKYDIVSGCGYTKEFAFATEGEKKLLFDALKRKGKRWNAESKKIEDIKKEHQFVPFEKVLIRGENDERWAADLFSNKSGNEYYPFITIGGSGWNQCIPYEGNEKLLGTTDNP